MSVAEWKKQTSLKLRRRGPRLRAVDEALADYHADESSVNLIELINAVELYRSTRPGGFEDYRRNKDHVFEALMSQIYNLASRDDDVLALAALPFCGIESWAVEGIGAPDLADAIKEERSHRLRDLLTGRAMRFRWEKLAWSEFKNWGIAGVQIEYEVGWGDGSGGDSIVDVVTSKASAVGNEFLGCLPISTTELAEAVPYLGVIWDALRTSYEWYKYRELVKDKRRFPGFFEACSGEAPDVRAAIEAVESYLDKRKKAQLQLAGLYTATLAAKVATTFIDGGISTHGGLTAAKALVKTYLTLQFAYDEYKEMKAAQAMIGEPTAEIFEACPLLGCYMITACDHSDILNMFDGRRNLSKYWQYEAMYYVKSINKLRDIARSYMGKSYIELVGPTTDHNTTTNKLHWFGTRARKALRRIDHQKEIDKGRAISSDSHLVDIHMDEAA